MYAGRNTELIIQLKEWKNKYELLQENHINGINTLKEQMFETEIKSYEDKLLSMEKIRDLEHKLLEAKGIII